ncbi:MAG TPA: hypothetical protein VFX03_13745, partial [Thermomicrobiales bacterium]|nr:hypothetical protein [Thermomicrobiales bacterium]
MRVFAADGDVAHFRWATGVSPWAIYAVGGYLVLWGLIDFYRFVLPYGLAICGFASAAARATTLAVSTALIFGYFAIPGLLEPDPMSQLIARTSLLAIPVIVVMRWPRIVAAVAPARLSPESPATLDAPGAATSGGSARER